MSPAPFTLDRASARIYLHTLPAAQQDNARRVLIAVGLLPCPRVTGHDGVLPGRVWPAIPSSVHTAECWLGPAFDGDEREAFHARAAGASAWIYLDTKPDRNPFPLRAGSVRV